MAMPTTKQVTEYIKSMYDNQLFIDLEEPEREKIIFTASELLKDNYAEKRITTRALALQVLYLLEGDAEEYTKLKMHGITDYKVKDVSVSFSGGIISPLVAELLDPIRTGKVGRLI